jgi:hypothetical protein
VSLSIIDLLFSNIVSNFDIRYSEFSLVTTRGVAVPVYDILLGIPEVLLRFIWLLVLPLPLQGGEAFGFLVSPARRVGALATGEESGASDQANQLEVLHIYPSIQQVRSDVRVSSRRLGIVEPLAAASACPLDSVLGTSTATTCSISTLSVFFLAGCGGSLNRHV